MSPPDRLVTIYALIDPRNSELRYIGKTVKPPQARLNIHLCAARRPGRKAPVASWVASLAGAGLLPEMVSVETVMPGGDWIESERFWIGYFRSLGARLCNLTLGGDGMHGIKQSAETIAKRIKRGPENSRFGKPMLPHVAEALRRGSEAMRADPARRLAALEKQRAAMTPERLASSIEGLRRANSDPVKGPVLKAKRAASSRTPEARLRVSDQSTALWATQREAIIAAQNAGKDDAWKAKLRELAKARTLDPSFRARWLPNLPRKLDAAAIEDIKRRTAGGEKQAVLAAEYGVTQSVISRAKTGNRRYRP